MSLKIIKKGLLDTLQDGGREGYRSQGIRPCGPMDRFSASMANALLGKDLGSTVIEMHFPASEILFSEPAIIVLTGADFTARINGQPIPPGQPVHLSAGATLGFAGPVSGQRCYLSVFPGFRSMQWLGSCSTDTRSGAGGIVGRALMKGDEILLESKIFSPEKDLNFLPWKVEQQWRPGNIRILRGPEWELFNEEGKSALLHALFTISPLSDRMGYRLSGKSLAISPVAELVSSAVEAGTIQCLPGGQLVVLMADHPTTGGYPRVASVASADLGRLAQMGPGASFRFSLLDQHEAEELYLSQTQYLQQVGTMGRVEMKKCLKGR